MSEPMSTFKKALSVVALATALFLASFVASFALGAAVANADTHAESPANPSTPHASEGIPPHLRDQAVSDEQAKTKGPHAKKDEHGHGDPTKHFNYFGSPFEHYGKDVYGGVYGDGKMVDPKTGTVKDYEEPMSAPFIFMVINFALLFGLLAWKAGPAANKAAAARHDQIKTALEEAARLRKQAADKLSEYESRLKDADSEIKKLVDDMRAAAEADKARILEAADRQAAQMKKDAEQRIAAEIELARASLTREITVAAVSATERILREKMMPGDQQKLVSTFIGDMQKSAQEAR